MYIIINGPRGESPTSVFNPEIGAIPFDDNNVDYQNYLKWIEEGNTPEELNNEL